MPSLLRGLNFLLPVLSSDHNADLAAEVLRKDPRVKAGLREFLPTDNRTNFLYIGRAWIIAGLTMAGAIAFFELRSDWGLPFWTCLPVYFFALLAIGASQHQLARGMHEAVHHTLFRNRKLNELAADFLCAFPILSSTYQFRLYHLAHHQFVNDPERDPDFALLKESGHWLDFPVTKTNFLWMMIRQLLLVDLIRYIISRVRFNTVGSHSKSPYRPSKAQSRRIPSGLALAQFGFVILFAFSVQRWGSPWMAIAFPLGSWAVISTILFFLPDASFQTARIRPVVHPRWIFTGLTLVFTLTVSSLTFVQMTTEFTALRYFSLLWYASLLTTFPFFMILRQVVQHGNGDRGWLTNTRVFRMSPPVRYAIFPFGMDYHLPHHMYASVPHYRLKSLHEFLMETPYYQEHCQLVDDYLVPRSQEPRNPTVVEVLGPRHARRGDEIHIDDSVLNDWDVDEKEQILQAGRSTNRKPERGPDSRPVA
ncbi:MAG: fatty acid desaturase [Verrucomicrobiota bacterium]